MIVHSVYFWLPKTMPESELAAFEKSLQGLKMIRTIAQGWVGTPAALIRPVIDRTYHYSLVVTFASMADHDAYQADVVHQQFLTDWSAQWLKVQIYDVQTEVA